MQIISRRKRSRLVEFHEADSAYRETGKREHAAWRYEAMRSKDVRDKDFVEAVMELEGRGEDQRRRNREVLKKTRLESFAPEDLPDRRD